MNPTPYRHAADRIVSRIAVPVLREPVFFCFMLLTFVWPQLTSDLFRIEATHWEILGLYIAYAYAATLPLGILGGKARRWYKAAAYTLAYAVSMAECFLLVFFRTFITPSLMSIATDTDPAESAEFIGCYLFTGRFALFLAAWSLVAGINLLLEKVSQARRTAPMPHAGLRTCLLTTVLAGGGIFGLTSNASAFESAWRLSRDVIHVDFLEEIFRTSDYISLNVPYNESTHHMIDAAAIAAMRPGVRIVNESRAEIVDDEAMIEGLASGKVGRYVTDFPNERLVGLRNCITTPHLGACTPESEEKCAVMAAQEIYDYLKNGNIKNSVNMPNAALERLGACRLCVIHRNVPNMINSILDLVSARNLNVEHMINKPRGEFAYTMMDLSEPVGSEITAPIEQNPDVLRVRVI